MCLLLMLVGVLPGCSPALNWREVPLADMTTWLPCKPDQASQTVDIGGRSVAIHMKGCEAADALFAISYLEADERSGADAMVQAWRRAALHSMRARVVSQRPDRLRADGQRSDGAPVEAELAWRVHGRHIYHAAIYAEHVRPEMSDMLMGQIRFP